MPKYLFDMHEASMRVRINDSYDVQAIISGYGLDINDDKKVSSDNDRDMEQLIKDHLSLTGEILVWSEDERAMKMEGGALRAFLTKRNAKCTLHFAAKKEHFDFWSFEHQRFLDKLKELGYTSTICRTSDNSRWVHRTFFLDGNLDAWIIAQMLPNGVIEKMFKTKGSTSACGNWYSCMDTQRTMFDRYTRLKKEGRLK